MDNHCLADYRDGLTRQRAARKRDKARFDSLKQEVFLNLWRTYDRLRALEDDLFSRFDLTPQP